MQRTFIWILIVLCACQGKRNTHKEYHFKSLTDSIAASLIKMPMDCVDKEFPNKLNQVLDSLWEMGRPVDLHPAFYGCFDWHSSVHGHWMMLALRNRFPRLGENGKVMKIMRNHITREKLGVELAYFQRREEKSFERPYGWAWFLKLTQEVGEMEGVEGEFYYECLKPLAKELSGRYQDFLPKLLYPVRSGEHSNTAFGMCFAYDYAVAMGDDDLRDAVVVAAKRLFYKDKNAPLYWEPSGYDFLSPCLEEANLMSRVLDKEDFLVWLNAFLPELKRPDFDLVPAGVLDRTDGKLAHLDGLNFSRAWCLYRIARMDGQYAHLSKIAEKHVQYSLKRLDDGNYSGDHWLGSFAVLALMEAG